MRYLKRMRFDVRVSCAIVGLAFAALALPSSAAAFSAAINFEPEPQSVYGFRPDLGYALEPHASLLGQFGWSEDAHAAAVWERGSPLTRADIRYQTFIDMSRLSSLAKWEMNVPNGSYSVEIVAGTPGYDFWNYQSISVEGMTVVDGYPNYSPVPGGSFRWARGSRVITVTDGRITMTRSSSFAKPCMIQIQSVGGTGEVMPVGDSPGWHQIFAEDFNVNKARGTMGASTPTEPVYTGSGGTQWYAYPPGYYDHSPVDHPDLARPYRADEVLSVENGLLVYNLHAINGQPAGANLSPVLPGSAVSGGPYPQYRQFGRFSVRMKVDTADLSQYHLVPLLWPRKEGSQYPDEWQFAESDFPEVDLKPGVTLPVSGFTHYGIGLALQFGSNHDMHDWHTYTQDWTPTMRWYYVDGVPIFQTAAPVYQDLERWQLQLETNVPIYPQPPAQAGKVWIDWATVDAYVP